LFTRERETKEAMNHLSYMIARKKLGESEQLRIGSSMSDELCSSPTSCISCQKNKLVHKISLFLLHLHVAPLPCLVVLG
jgi:hypothetical protein